MTEPKLHIVKPGELPTRQVRRARERRSGYWTKPDAHGRSVPVGRLSTQRPSTEGRERVSCRVIAATQARVRLSPPRAPRYAEGLRHAWQRKAAARKALAALLGAAA